MRVHPAIVDFIGGIKMSLSNENEAHQSHLRWKESGFIMATDAMDQAIV